MVNVMPQQVSLQGKTLHYLWDKKLGGPQSLSGYGGKKKRSLLLSGNEPHFSGHPACSLVTILRELRM